VQPAAIEAAQLASEDQARKHNEVLNALKRDLEAARYAARRAQKQYDATNPENRLVADELERRWNQALEHVKQIELRVAEQACPQDSTAIQDADLDSLAADLDAVWSHPDADARLKKRIVRALIHEVIADVDSQAGEIILTIHWKGGAHSELRLPRRRRGQNNSQAPAEVIDAARMLARICTDDVIAGMFNRNAKMTGRGNRWTRERVTALRSHHKIPCHEAARCQAEGWMNLTQAAKFLEISPKTLRTAAERGKIAAEHPLREGPWIFNRGVLNSEAASNLVNRVRTTRGHPTIPDQQNDLFDLSMT